MNSVNPENFNDTMKGYLIRVLRDQGVTEDVRLKMFQSLRWAIDEMTMEDARCEYDLYRSGEIVFTK